jgi:hypothetical protein
VGERKKIMATAIESTTRLLAQDALQRAALAGGQAGSKGEIVASGSVTLVAGVGANEPIVGIVADSIVFFSLSNINASSALGVLRPTITPGVGFTTTSLNSGNAPATEVGDASTYNYVVVNPS